LNRGSLRNGYSLTDGYYPELLKYLKIFLNDQAVCITLQLLVPEEARKLRRNVCWLRILELTSLEKR